jgi:MGT family glycosyltransferase
MSRIIAFTIPSPGHLFPFVPILRELGERGHQVRVALAAGAAGMEEIGGVPVSQPPAAAPALRQVVVTDGRGGLAEAHAASYAENGEPAAALLEAVLAAEHPDFVLVDPMLWGAMAAAEASGLPWASLAYTATCFRGMGLDLRGPGLAPPRGPLTRARYRLVERLMREAHGQYLPVTNAVRAARALPPLAHPWDVYHTPPLTIATTVEPFEYPRSDWPASLRFVGPVFWEPPMEAPPWIDELDERPVVLLAGASVPEHGQARSWTSVALQALASEPVQVVAALPTDLIPDRLPPNVHVARFLPLGAILPRTECMVCHGGMGTTQRALAAGVPVVAIPFAYDRFEVARRVEVAGAGVMLPGNRVTPRRVKAALREATRRRGGAERVAEAFARTRGAAGAADEVERVVGAPSTRARRQPAGAAAGASER